MDIKLIYYASTTIDNFFMNYDYHIIVIVIVFYNIEYL